MSVWDDRNLEIAAQSLQDKRRADATPTPVLLDSKGEEIPAGSNGFGNLCGVLLISIGGIGLVATGGASFLLSLLFIVGGCFSFGGEKICDNTARATHQAAVEHDPEGVNQAAASGCAEMVFLIIVLVVVVMIVLAGAMGGMG